MPTVQTPMVLIPLKMATAHAMSRAEEALAMLEDVKTSSDIDALREDLRATLDPEVPGSLAGILEDVTRVSRWPER